jgi:lipid-A-disaccharide synthase-like uncharacterized protein
MESIINHILTELSERWSHTPMAELIWLVIGFTAQGMFMMRFVVQWFASERAKRSIVPDAFWYWSIAGGTTLFIYATYRVDPVIMMGQATGLFIYIRNLQLIKRNRRAKTSLNTTQHAEPPM